MNRFDRGKGRIYISEKADQGTYLKGSWLGKLYLSGMFDFLSYERKMCSYYERYMMSMGFGKGNRLRFPCIELIDIAESI
jgi:hypothetical protein